MYLQDLEEIYPNLTSDLTTICLEGFHMSNPDHCLTLLIYHEYYAPILQLQFPNSHLSLIKEHIHPQIDVLLKTIITTHLPCLKNTLAAQHYASLAYDFLYELLFVWRYVSAKPLSASPVLINALKGLFVLVKIFSTHRTMMIEKYIQKPSPILPTLRMWFLWRAVLNELRDGSSLRIITLKSTFMESGI